MTQDNNRLSNVEVTILLANEGFAKAITDENGEFIILEVVDDNRYILLKVLKMAIVIAKIMDVEVRPEIAEVKIVLRLSEKIEGLLMDDFDLGTLEGWNVVDDTIQLYQHKIEQALGNDAPSGKFALSLWNDKAYTAKISQEV